LAYQRLIARRFVDCLPIMRRRRAHSGLLLLPRPFWAKALMPVLGYGGAWPWRIGQLGFVSLSPQLAVKDWTAAKISADLCALTAVGISPLFSF